MKEFLIKFKNNLLHTQNSGWACNPEYLLKYIKKTDNLIQFWKSLNKKLFYELSYENLIQDSENEIKSLLNYCELDWEENCLEFYKNKKSINTVSFLQARKPIYKDSLKGSENFKEYLNKLEMALKS